MDVSAFLILPCSGLVAFVTLLWCAINSRSAPRLIWPCAFSIVLAALIFLRMPQASELSLWVFALLAIALSAAFGTVIGAAVARLAIATFRRMTRTL